MTTMTPLPAIKALATTARGDEERAYWLEGHGVVVRVDVEVLPDLVREGPAGFLSIDYAGLLAPMIEALRTLHDRLRALEGNR